MIWTCRNRGDWARAGEWTENFTRWCGQSAVHLYSGNCRLHRAEVLHHRGEVREAEREAVEACRALAELAPYAQGDACRVLGDLRLAMGDIDAAEEAYRHAHELGWDPQPGLAELMVARGRAGAALRALERSLDDRRWANRQRRGLLLSKLVTVALAAGIPDRARTALTELDEHPDLWSTGTLFGMVCQARAHLAQHDGKRCEAIAHVREAIQQFSQVGAVLLAARQRLRLAELYLADSDRDAAELELSTARVQLVKMGALRLVEQAERALGVLRIT